MLHEAIESSKSYVAGFEKKTKICVCLFLVVVLNTAFLQQFGNDFASDQPCAKVDVLWNVFGVYPTLRYWSDIVCVAAVLMTAIFLRPACSVDMELVVRRCLLILMFLYVARLFANLITIEPGLPPGKPESETPKLLGMLLTFVGKNPSRSDLMFSGHACVISVCFLALWTYLKDPGRAKILALWFGSSVGFCIIIVVVQLHYSVDCYIAALVTSLTWGVYHLYMDHYPHERNWLVRLDGKKSAIEEDVVDRTAMLSAMEIRVDDTGEESKDS